MHEPQKTRPTIRLRRGEWDRRMTAKELETHLARAERIGVSRTTVGRIESGEIKPGEEFIAAVLDAFADLKFENVFEVVRVAA